MAATSSDGQNVLIDEFGLSVLGPAGQVVHWKGKGFENAEAAGFLGTQDGVQPSRHGVSGPPRRVLRAAT